MKIKNVVFFIILTIFSSCTFNPFVGSGKELDVIPPTLKIDSPKNNSFVATNFEIRGSCHDNMAINQMKISIDGEIVYSQKAHKNINIPLDIAEYDEGVHLLGIVLTDKQNNKTTVKKTIYLDKTTPNFELFSPFIENGTIPRFYKSIDFAGTISDSGSGLVLGDSALNTLVIHKKNNPLLVAWKFPLFGGNFVFPNNIITDAIQGEYTITVIAQDIVGNNVLFSEDIILVNEENTPVLVLEEPASDVGVALSTDNELLLKGYALDNSAIERVEYNFYGEDLTAVYSSYFVIPTTHIFQEIIKLQSLGETSEELPDGRYWLAVRAVDDEGVKSAETRVKIQKNASMPIVRILDARTSTIGSTPAPNSYQKAHFNFDVNCSKSGATIEYKVKQDALETAWTVLENSATADTKYTQVINIADLKNLAHMQDGAIRIMARAYVDAADKEIMPITTRDFFIDQTNPVFMITSHIGGELVNGALLIKGIASDNVALDATADVFNPVTEEWETMKIGNSWSYVIGEENDEGAIEALLGLDDNATENIEIQFIIRDKAGNEVTASLEVLVSPASDIPELVRYIPTGNNFRASGLMTVFFRVDDDDYPEKELHAQLELFQGGTRLDDYTQIFSNSTKDFPNCTGLIDTTKLIDKASYTARLSVEDWRGKAPLPEEFSFIVDNQSPIITLANPSQRTGNYASDVITISGTITDNETIQYARLYYTIANGTSTYRTITLSAPTQNDGLYSYSFNAVLKADEVDTGITGGDLSWGDNEWGNSLRTFQLRVLDNAGLSAQAEFVIQLDNHTPHMLVSKPRDNFAFGQEADHCLTIQGVVDDNPPFGKGFSWGSRNLKLELYQGLEQVKLIKDYWQLPPSGDSCEIADNLYVYKWHYDALIPDADDYLLKVSFRDDAGNEADAVEIPVKKSSDGPLIKTVGFEKKSHYGAFEFSIDAEATKGLRRLELYADGVKGKDFLFNEGSDFELKSHICTADASELNLTNNQVYELSLKIVDADENSSDYYLGTFLIDRLMPTIGDGVQFYTKDYATPVTSYSAFLRVANVVITDGQSMLGAIPYYTIGTTTGGSEISDKRVFTSLDYAGVTKLVASSSYYHDLSAVTDTIFVNVYAPDTAGNIQMTTKSLGRAAGLDTLADFTLPTNSHITGTDENGMINLSGSVASSCTKLFMQIDDADEIPVTNYDAGDTTFNHEHSIASLTNGSHMWRLRAVRGSDGANCVITRQFMVDHFKPLVTIEPKAGNLAGEVTFSGLYNDNFADCMENVTDAQLKLVINSIDFVIPAADITRKTAGLPWTWSHTLDLGAFSNGDYTLTIHAEDLAGNSNEADITIKVVN